MAAELIEVALKTPKYRDQLQEAAETVGSVPAKPDPRTARRQVAVTKEREMVFEKKADPDRSQFIKPNGELDVEKLDQLAKALTLLTQSAGDNHLAMGYDKEGKRISEEPGNLWEAKRRAIDSI